MNNKKYKILLIDDDAMTRILFKDSFLIYGKNEFEVYTASNFEEAEQYLKESKPDLIFLDLIFKDEHGEKPKGLEILKTLKSNPEYKDISVIVYSGYEELEKEAIQYGAKKFITKGFFLPKELVNSARSLIAELKNE